MNERIAITGASGFVGRHLVDQLKGTKSILVCLTRNKDTITTDAKNIEIREVDWESKDSIKAAIRDCKKIVHGAAIHPSRSLKNKNGILKFNVDGTRRLLESVDSIDRFIFISSMRALLNRNKKNTFYDEQCSYDFKKFDTPYGYSKYLSEKTCFEFQEKYGLPVIAINPASIIGANDIGPSPNGEFIRGFMKSRVALTTRATYSFVDVLDVANAIAVLLSNGQIGERYIVSSANWPLEQFIKEIHSILQVKRPIVFMPYSPTFCAAAGFELLEKCIPAMKAPVIRSSMYYAKLNPSFDGSKITKLGFSYRDPHTTLKETVRWLNQKYPV